MRRHLVEKKFSNLFFIFSIFYLRSRSEKLKNIILENLMIRGLHFYFLHLSEALNSKTQNIWSRESKITPFIPKFPVIFVE
jgi:hypothetical protein